MVDFLSVVCLLFLLFLFLGGGLKTVVFHVLQLLFVALLLTF